MKNSIKYNSISILGSTGSIGRQTLEVLDEIAPEIKVKCLTCNRNIELLASQAKKYSPEFVVVADDVARREFIKNSGFAGEVLTGENGLIAAAETETDITAISLVGFAGILPTYSAAKAGRTIALSNKEALVSAGTAIMSMAKSRGVKILPVDSEHSAVAQSLIGEKTENIEKIILTASGGPFRELPIEDFEKITLEQALNHPNWSMGNKITIDSATMMNKGFEVIEAAHLFGVPVEKIDVLIHPESIIHSMVQFSDGAVKAQLGVPDMKLPICYALTCPDRMKTGFERLNLAEVGNLTFEKPNPAKFKCLALAFDVMKRKGNASAVLNAANDIAVGKFLKREINFTDIAKYVDKALAEVAFLPNPSIDEIIDTISETKNIMSKLKI